MITTRQNTMTKGKGLTDNQNLNFTFDGFTERLKKHLFVIPVKTGIESFKHLQALWIPAFAGMTAFYESLTFSFSHLVFCLFLSIALSACSDLKEMREVKNAPMPPKYVEVKEKETSAEGSLWSDRASLYEDQRARRVNDIVTIVVAENTNASKKATTNTKRSSTVNDGITSLFGIPNNQTLTKSLTAGLAASGASAFAGEGDTATATIFTDTISAKVKEVLPNHNLVIESRKETIINNDKQIIVLRGIIRPEDISATNTVNSAQVADAQIYLVGKGVVDDKQSQGWMVRLLDQVWPF